MAGWIKLWRKLIENGHLKMPGTAFKLWIYCLLKAACYPDHNRDLAMGELWLSYQGLRENLGEGDKKVSMSTVSAALKYLEQNGYITLQAEKFKGIKAKIVNWTEYQSNTYSPADKTPTAPTVAGSESATTSTVAVTETSATPAVADYYSQSSRTTTPAVAGNYSHSSRPATPTVVVRAKKPDNGAGFSTAKNYIKNNIKNYLENDNENNNSELVQLKLNIETSVTKASSEGFRRSCQSQNEHFAAKEESTPTEAEYEISTPTYRSGSLDELDNRKKNLVVVLEGDFETEFGRSLSPIETEQLRNWQKTFSVDLIKEALACASRQDRHTITYIGGILKNWRRAGITTVDEVRRKLTGISSKGGKSNARDKPGYRPSEVDWSNEPATL